MALSDLDATTEAEIIALLKAWAGPVGRVIETHGAHVCIGRDEAIKIKRPVALAYMDFSTREKRHAACQREIEVNGRFAPELYLGLVKISREASGRLVLNGAGDVIELGVRMRAFCADDCLDRFAARGAFEMRMAIALGDQVAALHSTAALAEPGRGRLLAVIRERLLTSARARADVFGTDIVEAVSAATTRQLDRAQAVIDARRAAGSLRRCHGDLHLGNIVLWKGVPTPFDAIEFDEDLASLDPIYDLAFLLMDLCQREQRPAATLVLNRYLWRLGDAAIADGSWDMLRALPLCLSLRALVRAVVGVDRARASNSKDFAEARAYLAAALRFAEPEQPRLVAVGGLSGTGKSTLAARLAADLGCAPGAIHLRSDVERKGLFGVEPETRLGPEGYTREAGERTYARVLQKTALALAAGHSVIVDAVFAKADERAAIEAVARRCGVPFVGMWLAADADVLRGRVARRHGDASDATVQVLEKQLAFAANAGNWHEVDANGDAAATLEQARQISML